MSKSKNGSEALPMQTAGKRVDRARALRDVALAIVKRDGQPQEFSGGVARMLVASRDGLKISYRTPFQKWSSDSSQPAPSYGHAQARQRHPGSLAYGLDIWAPREVLNVEWNDTGEFQLVSYAPGAWEETLLGEAQQAA